MINVKLWRRSGPLAIVAALQAAFVVHPAAADGSKSVAEPAGLLVDP
jgi:hypothetical protein